MIKKNKVVFTEKRILDNKAVIRLVIHDEEDDWQFLTGDEVDESSSAILSMEQILSLDSSVENVLHINEGYAATRAKAEGEWIVRKY